MNLEIYKFYLPLCKECAFFVYASNEERDNQFLLQEFVIEKVFFAKISKKRI